MVSGFSKFPQETARLTFPIKGRERRAFFIYYLQVCQGNIQLGKQYAKQMQWKRRSF